MQFFTIDYISAGFDSLKTYEEGRSRSLEDKSDDGIGNYLIPSKASDRWRFEDN